MKFEDLLSLLRSGRRAYITSNPDYKSWIGKENYWLQYFESFDHFQKLYPDTKLNLLSEYPNNAFLACFMKFAQQSSWRGDYLKPQRLFYDSYFYSDLLINSEWETFY